MQPVTIYLVNVWNHEKDTVGLSVRAFGVGVGGTGLTEERPTMSVDSWAELQKRKWQRASIVSPSY